jgi:Protein of unknown function (DUF3313)
MINPLIRFLLSSLALTSLCSCYVDRPIPYPDSTRFLKSTSVDLATRSERLPFQHAWHDPKIDISRYTHIVVRPVNTTFLRTDLWVKSKSPEITTQRAYIKRCATLAKRWNKSLAKAFTSPICIFYKTESTTQPGTLILEAALTEVEFAPSPRKSMQAESIIRLPLCAFEARVTDAANGHLIATVADRRQPYVLLSSDTSCELICHEWSEQLMQASNKELFPTVRRNWFRRL